MTKHGLTAEDTKMVNATSRANGAVGGNALVPKVVSEMLSKSPRPLKVLDFGAGKSAAHTTRLREVHEGCNHQITAYDCGVNVNEELHDSEALGTDKRYDIVFASNVLNVQPRWVSILYVLRALRDVVAVNGTVVFNYPASPRKSRCTPAQVRKSAAMLYGVDLGKVERVAGTPSAPVFAIKMS